MKFSPGDEVRLTLERSEIYRDFRRADTYTVSKKNRGSIFVMCKMPTGAEYLFPEHDLELVSGSVAPPKKPLGYEVSL